MKTHEPKPLMSPSRTEHLGQVVHFHDDLLRRGHALLDDNRNREFADWIDQQLPQLEAQFRSFMTHRSLRKSLGR